MEEPAPARAHREPPELRGPGLPVLLVGGFVANYTFSSVNVAVPRIALDLDASPAQLGLVMACVLFAGYGAFMYVFALTVQSGLRQSPLVSGLTLLSFAAAFAVVSMNLGVFRRWFGSAVMTVGASAHVVALLGVAAVVVLGWPHPSQWLLQPLLALLGAAQALMFTPLLSAVMAGVPRSVAGLSGGLFSTVQQAALALGVAVYGGAYTGALPELSHAGAFGTCLAVQAATSVTFGLMARWLGAPGRG